VGGTGITGVVDIAVVCVVAIVVMTGAVVVGLVVVGLVVVGGGEGWQIGMLSNSRCWYRWGCLRELVVGGRAARP
jgi:hypothetical protein